MQNGALTLGRGRTPKGTLTYTVSFYPCLPVVDFEQEEARKKEEAEEAALSSAIDADPKDVTDATKKKEDPKKVAGDEAAVLEQSELENRGETGMKKPVQKLRLSVNELLSHRKY